MEKQAKIDFWHVSDEAKRDLFEKISKVLGVSPKAAEKDWWVCHAIKSIFEMRCADALTFKGGTSLSKAWGVSNRFSEDVDISIDKAFFGIEGETRSARDRIRKLSRKYIHEEMRAELAATLYVFGAEESEVIYKSRPDSDADPTVLLIPYRSVLPKDPYIKDVIKVEFSCRSPREPRQVRPIIPYAVQLSPLIDYPAVEVPTVVPTRTFLEKVFLLHEEFQKNYPRFKRMSRHLYDLYRLGRTQYAAEAMADTDLYISLVRHRSVFNAVRGIDYRGHVPANLSILPPKEVLPLWEEDYQAMCGQFVFEAAPSFKELIKEVAAIQDRLRSIPIREIPLR